MHPEKGLRNGFFCPRFEPVFFDQGKQVVDLGMEIVAGLQAKEWADYEAVGKLNKRVKITGQHIVTRTQVLANLFHLLEAVGGSGGKSQMSAEYP